MNGSEAFAALESSGRRVLTTSQASLLWGLELSAAAHQLSRLADSGLVRRLRHGIWSVGLGTPAPRFVIPVLTHPYPSYISMYSALFSHGLIEQIPRSTFAVSLDRSRRVVTTVGAFEIHSIHPELFGGFDLLADSAGGLATAEKALFDTVYLLSARGGRVTLPELEVPESFDGASLWNWVTKIPSRRLETLVTGALQELLRDVVRIGA